MFWGLIMEPQRRYTQKVKKSFHISMAALDSANGVSDVPSQVMAGSGGRTYLLCTLQSPNQMQCQIDLNFEEGSEIWLASNGKNNVHLTGYLLEETFSDSFDVENDSVTVKKSKKKKRAEDQLNGRPLKKAKKDELEDSSDSSEETDGDDFKSMLLGTSMEEEEDDDESFSLEEEEEDEDTNNDDTMILHESEEDNEDDEGEEEEEEDEENEDEVENGEGEEESSASEADVEEESVKKSPKKAKQEENGAAALTKKQKKQAAAAAKAEKAKNGPKKKTLQGGVVIEDIKVGEGPQAKHGKFVTVYYEGRLKSNNRVFDASQKGAGFSFRLGNGEVIKAWDVGVAGMKPGGKRRIVCPPNMAYGAKGSPPAIPANSTLVFEVELKKIK